MILRTRINICGIEIDNVCFNEVFLRISELIKVNDKAIVVTPNIDHIVRSCQDEEFRIVYEHASLVLADGMPILWAARFLGTPLKEKVSGSDLFPQLSGVAAQKGYKLFFLGGREGAAIKAAEVLRNKYPEIKIPGIYCPPYGFENDPVENRKIIDLIQQVKPDILFVGLGSPKQEKWIFRYKDEYQVPVSIGIGVSFEFVANMVKRAPQWMQNSGFEWFWRLCMEPGRLWKRYLIDDMQFFGMVLKQKFFKKTVNAG